MNLQFTLKMFQLRRNIDNNPETVPEDLKSLVEMRVKALNLDRAVQQCRSPIVGAYSDAELGRRVIKIRVIHSF